MAERIKYQHPSVEIVSGGEPGVVLKTTETIVREEPFIDVRHAIDATESRELMAFLKRGAAVVVFTAAIAGGAVGGYELLSKDLGNKDTTGQQRDVETMLLGAAGAYAAKRFFVRQGQEEIIGKKQNAAATENFSRFG